VPSWTVRGACDYTLHGLVGKRFQDVEDVTLIYLVQLKRYAFSPLRP